MFQNQSRNAGISKKRSLEQGGYWKLIVDASFGNNISVEHLKLAERKSRLLTSAECKY